MFIKIDKLIKRVATQSYTLIKKKFLSIEKKKKNIQKKHFRNFAQILTYF